MGECRVSVDHATIYRWLQKYAPGIEKQLRWQWRRPISTSWRVDETYVKVRGELAYLYRAIDKHGNTIDFYLSPTRNTAAAKRFLDKALNGGYDNGLWVLVLPHFACCRFAMLRGEHGRVGAGTRRGHTWSASAFSAD